MCAARPAARSLLTWTLSTAPASSASTSARAISIASCNHFHSSAQLAARRKPRFKSVRAEEMGLIDDEVIDRYARETFPELTPDQKKGFRKAFSPEQIAAVEAGEAAIDPKDLAIQGRLRIDPYRLKYIDDFKEIQPILDKRPRTKPPADPNGRFMDDDQFIENFYKYGKERFGREKDFAKLLEGDEGYRKLLENGEQPDHARWLNGEPTEVPDTLPGNGTPSGNMVHGASEGSDRISKKWEDAQALWDAHRDAGPWSDRDNLGYWMERSSITGGDKGGHSALAPALPRKVPGVAGLYKAAIDPADEGLDDAGVYRDLKKQTGMSVRQIMDLTTKTLVSRFVSNQTRLGKIRSSSVIVCAGNRNGWLGIGMAKSTEPSIATTKARMLAIRNMRPIPRYENRTIYGNTEAKVGATIVQLFTRPPGFGLRVSHRIFEMCRAAGIWDLSARMPRARNPMNSVKATYEALMKQKNPDEIARGRGKKLVDARKVYYGGAVY